MLKTTVYTVLTITHSILVQFGHSRACLKAGGLQNLDPYPWPPVPEP